jgi:hypothetical protein
VVLLRGASDYWHAYDGRHDFQVVVDALRKYTPPRAEARLRKATSTGQQPAGYFDPARLAVYQDRIADRGLVSRKVDVHQALGQRFVDYPDAVSGAYRPAVQPSPPD